MKSSRPITPTRGVLFCAALLLFCVVQSVAQSNYTFCSNNSYSGGAGSPAYFTPVFPLPDSIHPDEYNQISPGREGEPATSFNSFIMSHYSVSKEDSNNTGCVVFPTLSAAQAGLSKRRAYVQATLHLRLVDTSWVYSPMRQSTHTGMAAETEAEAIFNAEDRVTGPFENGKYPTIHSWDSHTCDPNTSKTSNYANAETVTRYICTVTYSYSDAPSPVAKAALGKGATREEAAQNARATVNNAQWFSPFCSKTFKADFYQPPGHKFGDPPKGSEWWVCEVDYTTAP